MTEKKRAWQVPQNWVIALLLGIAGYFSIRYPHKPKMNHLLARTEVALRIDCGPYNAQGVDIQLNGQALVNARWIS